MKGRFHTEEAVIPILQRKGIVVKQNDYDENGNLLVIKEIGIPLNVNPGLRILGKLDFMRRQGWKVLKLSQMSESQKPQKKTRREQAQEKEGAGKKKPFNKFSKRK